MADIGSTHTSPYSQQQLDDRVTSAGTTPLPLCFQGDTDTGLYRPAANTLEIVAGGAAAIRLVAGGLIQFPTTGLQANGTSGTTWSTSVRPSSAQETVKGWIRFNDASGNAGFIPYF